LPAPHRRAEAACHTMPCTAQAALCVICSHSRRSCANAAPRRLLVVQVIHECVALGVLLRPACVCCTVHGASYACNIISPTRVCVCATSAHTACYSNDLHATRILFARRVCFGALCARRVHFGPLRTPASQQPSRACSSNGPSCNPAIICRNNGPQAATQP